MTDEKSRIKRRRMVQRKCIHEFNAFCYVCGVYVGEGRRSLSEEFKSAYFHYFDLQVGDQDKYWAPHGACSTCYLELTKWERTRGAKGSRPFCVPVQWREPTNHDDNCFACKSVIQFTKKGKRVYGFCESATAPVLRPVDQPLPKYPSSFPSSDRQFLANEINTISAEINPLDEDYVPVSENNQPILFDQQKLDAFMSVFRFPKADAEKAGAIFREMNLLEPGTKTSYRDRDREILPYLSEDDGLAFVSDINGLFENVFKCPYDSKEYVLFIDSGKNSLKAALMHNEPDKDRRKPTLPIAYAKGVPESYATISNLLNLIHYDDHKWQICSDLKVVGFLTGLRGGYPHFQCHLCLWEGRKVETHYKRMKFDKRTVKNSSVGCSSRDNKPLVPAHKILIPPLHIKLGLMKQFVKAMNKDSAAFQYLNKKFGRRLSESKIKEGTFIGTQIRELQNDAMFESLLAEVLTDGKPLELNAWLAFRDLCQNFLGTHRAHGYKKFVKNFLDAYRDMGVKMNLKIHFLESHIGKFPPNMGSINDEHGERVHQDLDKLERDHRFGKKGQVAMGILANYMWGLKPVDWEWKYRAARKKTI